AGLNRKRGLLSATLLLAVVSCVLGAWFAGFGLWGLGCGVSAFLVAPVLWQSLVVRQPPSLTRGAAAGAVIAFVAQVVPMAVFLIGCVVPQNPKTSHPEMLPALIFAAAAVTIVSGLGAAVVGLGIGLLIEAGERRLMRTTGAA